MNNKLLFYKGFRLCPAGTWPCVLTIFKETFLSNKMYIALHKVNFSI